MKQIVFVIIWAITLITILNMAYKKGFEAGVEWERNIILDLYYEKQCRQTGSCSLV